MKNIVQSDGVLVNEREIEVILDALRVVLGIPPSELENTIEVRHNDTYEFYKKMLIYRSVLIWKKENPND